jgi:hypothetical protein
MQVTQTTKTKKTLNSLIVSAQVGLLSRVCEAHLKAGSQQRTLRLHAMLLSILLSQTAASLRSHTAWINSDTNSSATYMVNNAARGSAPDLLTSTWLASQLPPAQHALQSGLVNPAKPYATRQPEAGLTSMNACVLNALLNQYTTPSGSMAPHTDC